MRVRNTSRADSCPPSETRLPRRLPMFPHRPVLACALIASLWGPAAQVSRAFAQGETTTSAPPIGPRPSRILRPGHEPLLQSPRRPACRGRRQGRANLEHRERPVDRHAPRRNPAGRLTATATPSPSRPTGANCSWASTTIARQARSASTRRAIWAKSRSSSPGTRAPVKRLAFTRDGRYMASAGENGKIIVWNWPARRAVGAVEPRDPNQPLYHVFAIPSADPLLLVNEAAGPSVISLATARRLSPGDPIPESLRSWLATNPKVRFPHGAAPASLSLQLEQGAGWRPVWARRGARITIGPPRSAPTQSSRARSIAITAT
jgi:hypothetical protein